jgi:hypothetical protein
VAGKQKGPPQNGQKTQQLIMTFPKHSLFLACRSLFRLSFFPILSCKKADGKSISEYGGFAFSLSNLLSVVASQKIVAFSLLLVVSGGVVLVFSSPLINISLMLTVDSTTIVHVKLQQHTFF